MSAFVAPVVMSERMKNVQREVREVLFAKHVVKSHVKGEGFEKIVFGKKSCDDYLLVLVLSDNMLYVSGNMGETSYKFYNKPESIQAIGQRMRQEDFFGSLLLSDRQQFFFDKDEAVRGINQLFCEWCSVQSVDDLDFEDENLRCKLVQAARSSYSVKVFEAAVARVKQNSSVEWFELRDTIDIAKCGKSINNCFLAYWVGIEMIAKEISEKQNQLNGVGKL